MRQMGLREYRTISTGGTEMVNIVFGDLVIYAKDVIGQWKGFAYNTRTRRTMHFDWTPAQMGAVMCAAFAGDYCPAIDEIHPIADGATDSWPKELRLYP